MEEEKKKKKNKKKKNKQAKQTEDGSAASEGITPAAQNPESVSGEIHNDRNGETPTFVERSKATHEIKDARLTDMLEDKIRALEAEKYSWLQKEKCLEEEIKRVDKDRLSWIMKEASLEDKLAQLENERNNFLLTETNLEATIKNLEKEKETWLEKETNLETSIKSFESEKRTWMEKEGILEKQISRLQTEVETWIMKEASAKVTIENLNGANEGLLAKVKELEESQVNGVKENQHLVDKISDLEHRNQFLEREMNISASSNVQKDTAKDEDSNSLIQSACALVEKLVVENSELVEKVNELSIKLNKLSRIPEHTAVDDLEHTRVIPVTGPSDALSPPIVISDTMDSVAAISTLENIKTPGNGENTINFGNGHANNFGVEEIQLESSEGLGSGEIVPVPLEDDEIHQLEAGMAKGEDGVPLSDAPLIGAPFRLISFVAKYVSGADLVDQS